jgi:hypothetical protein
MKIFISSTYDDLIDHRKAVIDAILRLGHQPIAMEYFGSKPVEPKIAALDKLEESDVLVGIYAYRYGTIPKGDSKSITEQEFDSAIKLGIPCFCYRVDEDSPWPPKYNQGRNKKKRDVFLKKIDRFLRSQFTNQPDQLAKQVAADLKRDILPESTTVEPAPNCHSRLKDSKKVTKALGTALQVMKKLELGYLKETRLSKSKKRKI